MINAHIRDAAALCRYFSWLEKEVGKGAVTEISGAKKLEEFRRCNSIYFYITKLFSYLFHIYFYFSEQEDFMGLSFETISSVGPNAAIIHYSPSPESDRLLTMAELYLCDSGGQYK